MKEPAGHLGRMYGLLFLLLGAIGLNAGWLVTMSYGIGDHAAFEACVTGSGAWWAVADPAVAEATRHQTAACLRPVTLPWAIAMVAGAVTAYAVTVLLAVAGSVRMRRLIHAAGRATGPAVDAAVARFTELCREHGVSGRRPELHVLRPGARFAEPFTLGGLARRPVVVVPAALACADPGVLEPVLRHELAHVRSRDALLASGVWWSGWAGALLPVAAAAPLLDPRLDSAPGYGAGMLVAVVLGVLLLALRAHVLRAREIIADRAAVDRQGRPGAFAELLATRGPGRRPVGRLRSLFAVHPDPATRRRALTAVPVEADGGFLPSAVTALVAFLCVQPVHQVVLQASGWAGPSTRLLYAVAGGLVAVLLMPVWARRFADDPRASWWPPVLGVAVGGAAGFFLPGPGLPISPGLQALSTRWIAGPLLLLVLGALAVLLVGLAHGTYSERSGPVPAATAAGSALAAVIASTAVQTVIEWAGGAQHPTFLRQSMLYGAAVSDAEPVAVFAAVAVLALVAARSGPRRRPASLLLSTVVITAASTGSVVTVLRLSPDGDVVADLPLLWYRWWVSALAGVIVTVVLLTRPANGRPVTARLAGALSAAAAVTLAVAIIQFAVRVVATGWDPGFHPWLLGQYVMIPLRLLTLLSVVVAPVVLAAARWSRPPTAVPARLCVPVIAALTAIVCAGVMVGSGEAVTGGVADARRLAAAGE